MKYVLSFIVLILGSTQVMANSYKHCQTSNGELEFILPVGAKHLFMAPHSLISNQRQIASLKASAKDDVTQWETLHFKVQKNHNIWSQQNLNFSSNFSDYLEVALNDGKTHTFSIKCTQF